MGILVPRLTGVQRFTYIGDSLTRGVQGGGGPMLLTGGFREILSGYYWNDAAPLNTQLDAVGSQGVGTVFQNFFCFAFSGQSIDQFFVGAPHGVEQVLTNADPTQVPIGTTLLLGTNNMTSGAAALAAAVDMGTLLGQIFAGWPTVRVLVITIPPRGDFNANSWTNIYNNELTKGGGVWDVAEASGQKIVRADLNPVIDVSTMIGTDGVHMNDLGYTTSGDFLWPLLRNLFGTA